LEHTHHAYSILAIIISIRIVHEVRNKNTQIH